MRDECIESDVVSHLLHNGLAGGIAFRVRWAHIRRKETEDVPECHLVVMHLVDHVFLAHLGQILVCPGMTRYLMAISMHSANQGWIARFLDVHLAFSEVVSGDEKGRLCIVTGKDV